MVPPAGDEDCFSRPLKPPQKLPIGHGSGLREPNRLTKELANRTVFVVAKLQRRIVGNGSISKGAGHIRDENTGSAMGTCFGIAAGLVRATMVGMLVTAAIVRMAAGVMPLAGEQVQTFPHRRHRAKENGECPSTPDSPGARITTIPS